MQLIQNRLRTIAGISKDYFGLLIKIKPNKFNE
jgi:hypothetical protein